MSNWLLHHVTAIEHNPDLTVEIKGTTFSGYLLSLDEACEKRSVLIYSKNNLMFEDLQKARYSLCVSSESDTPTPLQFFKTPLTERALIGYDQDEEASALEILDEENGCTERLTLDDEKQPATLTTTHADGAREIRNYQFDHTKGEIVMTDYLRYDSNNILTASLTFPESKFEIGPEFRNEAAKKSYEFLRDLFELETTKGELLLF
jgi:hypothetical protein